MTVCRHYSEQTGSMSFYVVYELRRLWRTLRDARRPSGAHGAGLGLNFLGLIIIIALNGYNGYFSRYFNRWHARINHGRIIHKPDITMMQCYSISLPRRQRISRRPREMRRTFFRLLFDHFHAGVAVFFATRQ